MQCPELNALLSGWVDDIEHPPLEIAFDEQTVILVHAHPDIRVDVATGLSADADIDITSVLRYAETLYSDHDASLAINPDDNALWLVSMTCNTGPEDLLRVLETTLNQRDTCQQWLNDIRQSFEADPAHRAT